MHFRDCFACWIKLLLRAFVPKQQDHVDSTINKDIRDVPINVFEVRRDLEGDRWLAPDQFFAQIRYFGRLELIQELNIVDYRSPSVSLELFF